MSQSVGAALQAAQAASKGVTKSRGEWHRVCVCGHLGRDHGDSIGGEFGPTRMGAGRVHTYLVTLPGCCGQPLPPKTKKHYGNVPYHRHPEIKVPDPKVPGREIGTAERFVTCPCRDFRPVLEVFNPGARFNQWAPVNPPRSGQRDHDPIRHPVMRGVKATLAEIQRGREIQNLLKSGREDDVESRVEQLLEERIRWLPDGQRCWSPNCDRTDSVLPCYVDGDDRSEMRCPKHQPYS